MLIKETWLSHTWMECTVPTTNICGRLFSFCFYSLFWSWHWKHQEWFIWFAVRTAQQFLCPSMQCFCWRNQSSLTHNPADAWSVHFMLHPTEINTPSITRETHACTCVPQPAVQMMWNPPSWFTIPSPLTDPLKSITWDMWPIPSRQCKSTTINLLGCKNATSARENRNTVRESLFDRPPDGEAVQA